METVNTAVNSLGNIPALKEVLVDLGVAHSFSNVKSKHFAVSLMSEVQAASVCVCIGNYLQVTKNITEVDFWLTTSSVDALKFNMQCTICLRSFLSEVVYFLNVVCVYDTFIRGD